MDGTRQNGNESDSTKVEIEELEHCLLGPAEPVVDIRHIMNAKGKTRRRLFQILSAARWDKFSMVRARQEEESQVLSKVIKHMSEKAREALWWNVREI